MDVSMTELEERVYQNVFSKYVSKRTCKEILDRADLQFVSDQCYLVQHQNAFQGVYLVAKLKNTHQLIFLDGENEIYKEERPYTWHGVIEYDLSKKAHKKKEIFKWPISIYIDKKRKGEFVDNDKLSDELKEPIYVYFFREEKLKELYDADNGIHIRNALHSIWLSSMCYKIIEIDMKVSKFLNEKNKLSNQENNTVNNDNKVLSTAENVNVHVNQSIDINDKEKYKINEISDNKTNDLEQKLIDNFQHNKDTKKVKNLSSNEEGANLNSNTVKTITNLLVEETDESKFRALKTENEDSLEKIKIIDQEAINKGKPKEKSDLEQKPKDSTFKDKNDDALEVNDIQLNENLEFSDFDIKDQNQIDNI